MKNLIFLSLILSISGLVKAQPLDTTYTIQFEKIGAEDPNLVKWNGPVSGKVWLNNGERPVRGIISAINDSTLLVNEHEVSIAEVSKIRLNSMVGKGIGFATLGLGLTTAALGSYILYTIDESADGLSKLVSILGGGALLVAGVCVSSFGIVATALTGAKFDMQKWDIVILPEKGQTP